MNTNDYFELLESAYCNPVRPQWRNAIDFLYQQTDNVSVWTKLVQVGLVPRSFATDPCRAYGDSNIGFHTSVQDRPSELIEPSSPMFSVLLASDMAGVTKAESLAKEHVARLSPWGAKQNNKIVWYATTRPINYVSYLGLAYESARDTLSESMEDNGFATPEELIKEYSSSSLPYLVRKCLASNKGWEIAIQNNIRIDKPNWPFNSSAITYRELKNPFEAILDLWLTGYLLFSDHDKDLTCRMYMVIETKLFDR